MTQTVLVPATMTHPALTPDRGEVNFISRQYLTSTNLYPKFYCIIRKSDGSVIRCDYDSAQDYNQHKARIDAKLAKHHAKQGKLLGCSCSHCRMTV